MPGYAKFFLGFLLSLLFVGNAYAEERPNCLIRITQVSSAGQKEKIQFGTHLTSRAECQALARIHERSQPSPETASKKVAFKWKAHHGKRVAMR